MAEFSTVTLFDSVFKDQTTGVNNVYVGQANWIMQDNMNSCGTSNVSPGPISSSGVGGGSQDQFTETWLSSQNTPYWTVNPPPNC